jgi:hypothetical protein
MFMEVPIIWKSKTQQSVVLSSAEAEYISSTELVKEVLWITQILEFLQMTVTKPVPIYIDNISAIHMVRNNISTTNTRHMNIKHESGIVEYLYVQSENNTADILTKNATKHEYDKHAPKLVDEVPSHLIPQDNDDKDKDSEVEIQSTMESTTKKTQMKYQPYLIPLDSS